MGALFSIATAVIPAGLQAFTAHRSHAMQAKVELSRINAEMASTIAPPLVQAAASIVGQQHSSSEQYVQNCLHNAACATSTAERLHWLQMAENERLRQMILSTACILAIGAGVVVTVLSATKNR